MHFLDEKASFKFIIVRGFCQPTRSVDSCFRVLKRNRKIDDYKGDDDDYHHHHHDHDDAHVDDVNVLLLPGLCVLKYDDDDDDDDGLYIMFMGWCRRGRHYPPPNPTPPHPNQGTLQPAKPCQNPMVIQARAIP